MAVAWIDLFQALMYMSRGALYVILRSHVISREASPQKTFQSYYKLIANQLGDWSNISMTVLCLGLAMLAVSIGYLDGISSKLKSQRWIWIFMALIIPLPVYFTPYAIANESQLTKIPIWMVGRPQRWPIKNCVGHFCFLPDPNCSFFSIIVLMNFANVVTSFLGWYRIYQSKASDKKSFKSRLLMMRILVSFGIANLASWIFWMIDEAIILVNGLNGSINDVLEQLRACIIAFRGMFHAVALYYTLRALKANEIPRDSASSLEELSVVPSFDYSKYGEKTTISIFQEPDRIYNTPERDTLTVQWSVSEPVSSVTEPSKYF
jgi:hypothetical protein